MAFFLLSIRKIVKLSFAFYLVHCLLSMTRLKIIITINKIIAKVVCMLPLNYSQVVWITMVTYMFVLKLINDFAYCCYWFFSVLIWHCSHFYCSLCFFSLKTPVLTQRTNKPIRFGYICFTLLINMYRYMSDPSRSFFVCVFYRQAYIYIFVMSEKIAVVYTVSLLGQPEVDLKNIFKNWSKTF